MQVHIRNGVQLGVALKRFRRKKKLTQVDLAEDAGIRQATVSMAESGSDNVQLSTIISLIGALDLELVLRPRLKGTIEEYLEKL